MKKSKVLIILLLSILLSLPALNLTQAAQISVYVNGNLLKLDTPPITENGRTLVPLRGIFEALDAQVNWDSYSKTISAQKGETKVRIQIGNKKAIRNGKEMTLDIPAKVLNNRTFVPLRFIGESFGAQVLWDSKTSKIQIISTDNTSSGKKLTIKEVSQNDKAVVLIKTFDKFGDEVGTGSGFIVTSDGKVVTNYHVIDQAYSAQAITSNNKTYKVAGVYDYDIERDLAIIKLENASSLPVVKLGNSDKVAIGDEVVAIGSPIGLQNTVSNGIVSSLRTLEDNNKYIQTSAPVSPGSSGGALFNLYGEVIGVIVGQFDGQNLNLAIPVNEAKPMLKNTKVHSLLHVLREVYPRMSYQEFADYIFENYNSYPLRRYNLDFDGVAVFESEENPKDLMVFLPVGEESYSNLNKAYSQGYEGDIENWIYYIYKEAELRYQDKNVLVMLVFDQEYDQKPNFADEVTEYNPQTGKYEVFFPLLAIDNKNGKVEFTWFD